MPSKSPAQRLRDIVENIDAIQQFIGNLDLARSRLPADLKNRHPEIDWTAVAAAGNVYRHEYETIDEALIWQTAQHSLEPLKRVALAEFNALAQHD